ncbi:hypothetical protein HanRHA438_Chr09g0382271 [Helianthus annuus]|uniref:Reverse transcriptase zinc-binding domain-containing protein n=1 Tax=Helianthus annuus TaxID=4232 RepID=A0A9K3I3X5_HELAN|nr:hypothetical protein HanXRQr2_Chr09g0370671 [Helianthus annuus]KAJ0541122.1 hypothetical protein HanHA89_Chr09g0324881 [Helianthus annuus]KAJ0706206.1 hypothetical protein HanLR1_Chr09g0304401 [Helianthus annuus]KAJ0886683.1 hypothetical protein HanRHA438_Chr09g0382271 [Helianthus annuus]
MDCIATKTALARRGVVVGDTNRRLCGFGEETNDHLAASCVLVRAVWWHVCVWLKIPVCMQPLSLKEVMDGLFSLKGSADWKKVIEVVFHTTLWRIWKARNAVVFEGISFNASKLMEDVKEDSFMWIKYRSKFKGLEWERWQDSNVRDIIL